MTVYHKRQRGILAVLLLFLLIPCLVLAESLSLEEMEAAETAQSYEVQASLSDRDRLIDDIIQTAKELFERANGRPMRAQYSGDIYICKNFTVHVFRENARNYRMAAFPDTPLVIPNNLPGAECKPYAYGLVWMQVDAEEGNPFYTAAEFRYDEKLSKQENREKARQFMTEVRRGDFFQMSASYYYGVGAHSLIFIADYDPETGNVRWTDSNMKGMTRNGERYAYVQYDAEKEAEWFVDAFCQKKRGATLYRLRDDIIALEK